MELPAKLFDRRYFSMTSQQQHYYQLAKEIMLEEVEQTESEYCSSYAIFRLFTSLQQIVSGFWNRNGRLIEIPHVRLDALAGALEVVPDGEKVIIWCKYHYSIRGVVAMLVERHGADRVAQFHGGIGENERNRELDRFRRDANWLVSTQASGGHGLTLTESRWAMMYENEFKFSNRLQAEDRQHRIGMTRRPTYIDIVCSPSIDDRIQKALAKKGNLVEDFKRQVDAVKDRGKAEVRKMIAEL